MKDPTEKGIIREAGVPDAAHLAAISARVLCHVGHLHVVLQVRPGPNRQRNMR
jgi:hypothetical protein